MNFECLANEFLLDLFEHFDGLDLLRAFSGLNYRFDTLLFIHFRRYAFNFEKVSKIDFDYLCEKYLPLIIDRTITLHLRNDDYTPEQINSFFTHNLPFNQFTNLKSLSLSKIECSQTMNKILHEFCDLTNLIHLTIVDSWHFKAEHLDIIWSLPKLISCKLNRVMDDVLSAAPTVISYSLQNVFIRCSVDGRASVNRLLLHTPCLERLSMSSIDHDSEQISFEIPSIRKLKIWCEYSPNGLKNLLQHMPNLSNLSVIGWNINIYEYQWEKIITDHLPKLKIFHLNISMPSNNVINSEEEVNQILDLFRTPFWINERHWFVRCHWNTDVKYSSYYLYTLPYSLDTVDYRMGPYFKSTCPQEDDYSSYDSVHVLCYESLPSTFVSHMYFPNIQHLSVTIPIDEDLWSVVPTLDRLTSLYIHIKNDDINQSEWQILLDKTTQLYSLGLSADLIPQILLSHITTKSVRQLDLRYINGFFDEETCAILSHSPLVIQCQFLTIKIENPENVLFLINHMKNLQALIVQYADEIWPSNYHQLREKKNRIIDWCQQHLPSTCAISKQTHDCFIRIWIR